VLNAPEAPRSWRWTALMLALLYQSLWCIALIWLMYIRFLIIPWEAPGETGDGSAIEVTWIDETHTTASALPTPLPEPLPASLPTPLPEPATQQASTPSPSPDSHEPASAASESPLMLTEVETPDEDAFTLSAPAVLRPEIALPSPALPTPVPRELALTEVPLLQRPDQRLPSPAAPLPSAPPTPELELYEREIPAPLSAIELHPLPIATAPPLDLPVHSREIREREIPAPLPEIELPPPSPSALPPPVLPSRTREIAEREIVLTPPVAGEVREIAPTPPTQSPPVSANDVWQRPSPPGNADTGLLDEHGRPRLAGRDRRAGGGLPPGTIIEDYANIDRMGSWRKRASADYQSSQLDSLWVPHEDILEEWVRRSIKNIWIPIPGTNKVIRCTVVLLMLGGGCGVTDPNLLDIEASARPPPDIPFKPELHEDQDSLDPDHRRPPPSSDEE